MSEFTPGPWKVTVDQKSINIRSENYHLGEVYYVLPDFVSSPQRAECEANAHLIAVAPEMYEVLEELVNGYDFKDAEMNGSIVRLAEKVLIKARGEL